MIDIKAVTQSSCNRLHSNFWKTIAICSKDLISLKGWKSVLQEFQIQIEGHIIHQLNSVANSVWIRQNFPKLSTLPIWQILCPAIQDFTQNIFGIPKACSITLKRSFYRLLSFCSKFSKLTIISTPILSFMYQMQFWNNKLFSFQHNCIKIKV